MDTTSLDRTDDAESLRQAIDALPHGVCVLGRDGARTAWNPAFEALGRGEGHPAPDDPALRRQPDGRWVRVRTTPLPEGRTLVVLTDATLERLRAEQADRTAAMMDALVEAMPASIAIKDRKLRYIKVNRRFVDLVGLQPHEILGRTADAFLAGETHALATASDRAALETGADQPTVELQIPRVGGAPTTVMVSKRPLRDRDGEVRHVLTVGLDVSAHRAAEADRTRLAELISGAVEAIPSGIAVFDPSYRLVLCNTAYADVAGMTREQMLGMTNGELLTLMHGVLAPSMRERVPLAAWIADRNAAVEAADGTQSEMALADGRWFLVSVRPLPDGGRVVVRTDITPLKSAQSQAEAAREAAERANRAKSQFLMNMSHELRTPLNAVIGFAEVIRDQLVGPVGQARYVDYARDIHASGMHLLSVIGDLLDMSKIDVGRYELEEEVVDLEEVSRAGLAMVRTQADAAGVGLSFRDDASGTAAPARVLADRRAVMQILLNLLGNAVKFTPAGGRVLVSVRRDADGWIRLSVADSGIGIPGDVQPRLFEPFQMGDAAIARRKGGSGLGLWISRSLIRLHGGSIALESAPGAGTTVTVGFPPKRAAG